MNKYVLLQGIVMPLLTQISNTSTVYANAVTATVPGFNDIRSKVNEILVTNYGYTNLAAINVRQAETISAKQWNDLITDYQKIHVHLNDTAATFTGLPVSNTVITEQFVNDFVSKINNSERNMSDRPPTGQRSSTNNVSTRTATWGSSAEHIIEHTVDYSWLSGTDATHFFSLGGRLSFALTSANGTGSTSTYWANQIAIANSALSSVAYDHTNYSTSRTLYTDSSGTIVVKVEKLLNSQFRANVKLNPIDFNDINLDITSAITCEYSSGALDAPQPLISEIRLLTTSTSVAPPIDYTPKLSITSPTSFTTSTRSGSYSTTQTVFINNIGNTATTITDIQFVDNSYISPLVTYNAGWTLVSGKYQTTIPVGESRTFGLRYTGDTVGTYYGRFSIVVPAITNGAISQDTTIQVLAKTFDFSVNPSSINVTTISSSVLEAKFAITSINGTYSSTPITSISTNTGYTIVKNELTGPTVQFNGQTNTTFLTTLSITATGVNSSNESTTVTKTVPISVIRNAPTTANLGTWKSALQPFNGIIGASYDVIDGKRHVTLGFGMGADGSLSLGNDSSGASAFVELLGTNTDTIIVDSKYYLGNPTLYAGASNGAYVSFLQSTANVGGYGTWIRPSGYLDAEGGRFGPFNVFVERTYKFITTRSGAHLWSFSSDNGAYFTIDNNLVSNLMEYGEGSYQTEFTGSVNLEPGEHTLTFYVANNGGPAAVALRIIDPANLEVWSTRFPVRIGFPYQNWQEVYRIPLSGNAETYQCNDTYCIKNSNNVNGKRWGYYFGAAGSTANSMFTVTDDGSGNIAVAMNTVDINSTDMVALRVIDSNAYTTISTAPHLFYYYSNIRNNNSYTQLSPTIAADGTTQYFVGFAQNGTVRTSNVLVPTDPTNTVTDQGGGGCPAPDVPITLADMTTKPAGEIQVGDILYTVHENTREFGTFPVTATEIEPQHMVNIIFTDGTTLSVSKTHKFLMTAGNWKQVFELESLTDVIKGLEIDKTVESITDIGIAPAVKLTVADAHTYIAAGLISHNIKQAVNTSNAER